MLKQIKEFCSSRIFHLIIKDKKALILFAGVIVSNLIAAFIEGGSFGLILFALTALSEGSLTSQPLGQLLPIEKWFQGYDKTTLFTVFIVLAILFQALRSALNYLGQLCMIGLSIRLQKSTQFHIFEQIFKFSFRFVSRYKIGDLIEYAKTPETSINTFMDALNRVFVNVFMSAALILFMCGLSLKLTFFTFILFGSFVLMQKNFMKRIAKQSTRLSTAMVELSKSAVQYLQGLRAIHTFGRQKGVLSTIEGMIQTSTQAAKKLQIRNQCVGPVNETLGMLLTGTVLLVGPFFLQSQQDLVLATLLTFLTLTYRLSSRLQIIMINIGSVMTNAGYLLRLKEILSLEDKEFAEESGEIIKEFKRSIEFKKVSLFYEKNGDPAINNVNFVIPQGKMTAFVGPSGAGKSSLIDLIIKLYCPTDGAILVDGLPIHNIESTSWRQLLGVVSQDAIIFNDTIEENIRFGCKTASYEEVLEAARVAQAHDFIMKLPQGYQTEVGERGYRLSGGERQRLSFSRAILRKPQILILDEATSNLDSHSEYLIQKALQHYRINKTVIVIAHRLSTIADADQIIVLDKGKIVEKGSHEELIAYDGIYSSLWNIQIGMRDQQDVPLEPVLA